MALEALEKEIFAIAPPNMISWNATRMRVNCLPEPRDIVDALIEELRLGLDERAALDRQAKLFRKHAGGEDAPIRQSGISARLANVGKVQPSAQPEDVSERRKSDSEDVAFAVGRLGGFERVAADGERYVAHRFKDGLYLIAYSALT